MDFQKMNVTSLNSDPLLQPFCDAAEALDFTTLYQWQNAVKMLFSIAAIPIIVHMIITKKYLIYKEHHFIIHFKIAVILVFAMDNTITCALQITDRLFNSEQPCQWVRPVKDCIILRAFQTSSFTSISTTLFFITLEKGIFVVFDPSRKHKSIVTGLFSVIQCCWTSLVFATAIWIDYDNTASVLHCAEQSVRSFFFANTVSYVNVVCSGLTLVSSVFLHIYIGRQLRKEVNLGRSFILRQSKVTNNAFLPLVLFHTLSLVILNIAFIIIRPLLIQFDKTTMKAMQGLTNMTPYYAFIAPLLLMYGMHRLKEGRKKEFTEVVQPKMNGKVVPATLIYEATLHKMWSE